MPRQVLEHFNAIGERLAPELQRELEAAQASDPVPGHAGVIIEAAKHYAALVERSWWLLVPPIGSRFICSDCPVLMENPTPAGLKGNMGLLVAGVVLYLPLSPHLMLMVADTIYGLSDRRVRHIGEQEFLYLRWLTGTYTERFIYGREADDLEVPEGSWVGGRRLEIVNPDSGPQG